MDLLLTAIEQTTHPNDLDSVFNDTDYDFTEIPWVQDSPVKDPTVQDTAVQCKEIVDYCADYRLALFTDDFNLFRAPYVPHYKMKRLVSSFRQIHGSAQLHRETGKCSSAVILVSLVQHTVGIDDVKGFTANMFKFFRWEYNYWNNKKKSDVRKTMLTKYARYNKVLKTNCGQSIF